MDKEVLLRCPICKGDHVQYTSWLVLDGSHYGWCRDCKKGIEFKEVEVPDDD